MSELSDDLERLADIGDQVLAGTPIESFALGRHEIYVVIGYCRRAVESFFDEPDPAPVDP